MTGGNEISAMIQLLDDPDSQVFQSVSQNLLSHGSEIIPILEEAWESSASLLLQERIENLIQDIHNETSFEKLAKWKASKVHDVVEGASIIASFQYPDLQTDDIRSKINKLIKSVWLELNHNLTSLEKVRIINHFFFEVSGFSGNQSDYYSPQNNFLNSVLETKKGNPISLGIIYTAVARGLDLPVFGVNLPKNFILAYMDAVSELPGEETAPRVLFYINAFRNGAVLNRKEIDNFIKKLELKPDPLYYQPCPNLKIAERLCLNLVFAYKKLGQTDKAELYRQVYERLSS